MIVNVYLFDSPANLAITIDGGPVSQCFRPGHTYLEHVSRGFDGSFSPSYLQHFVPDTYQLLLTADCPDNLAIRSLLLSLPSKFPELFI